ncbi:RNA-directed DNA polymerase (reverse transcriptase)-related family protein [Rhynchospora pubera]|uniref:RNA-directed DNA polymerase (Reverse transcriptase)-related family protein n=1 Tax=Rhynchospora pubera TaxID=906938 RepID=A0AAV8FNH5_9POAL|nr:RNA-directed DNA polymerase (reverse transcriptase)-related family protein [Rhynchospora pubera]
MLNLSQKCPHLVTRRSLCRRNIEKESRVPQPLHPPFLQETGSDSNLTWRWTQNGSFSSASAYRILADTGVRSSYHLSLWKIKAPLKVRIFLWLLLQNRLLTQENLLLRGWPSIQSCITCQTTTMETAPHLFIHCPFAHRLWDMLQTRLNLPVINFTTDLVGFWLANRSLLGDQWDIIWAAASWALWKERNARIFSAETSIQSKLLENIVNDVAAWTLHI